MANTRSKKTTEAAPVSAAKITKAEDAKVQPNRRDMNVPSGLAEAERAGAETAEVTDPLKGAIVAGSEGPNRFTAHDPEMESMTKANTGLADEDVDNDDDQKD